MTSAPNENWQDCPTCGAPVLVDPQSGRPDPCSSCAAKQSNVGLYLGGLALLIGLSGVAFLVYICIRTFLR